MAKHFSSSAALPDTSTLLAAGGDARITINPATGTSQYGCRPVPDRSLVAFGSSTGSPITEAGYTVAAALRLRIAQQIRHASPAAVYADHAALLRSELLACCGLTPRDDVQTVLAASGTDLFLLATQWIKPQRTVMLAPAETGSGVPAAVQGQHFNIRAAGASVVPVGAPVGMWQGALVTLAVRNADGSLRHPTDVDAECFARVSEAAALGQRVLLIVTDVSKTGLIAPGIEIAMRLKARFPEQVEILVDACQFRLAPSTIRAYLAQNCLVAITGSKFVGGPTFCGALLIPSATMERHRYAALDSGAKAYSNAADWSGVCLAKECLPRGANFGLLLRWAAALTELRVFAAQPEALIAGRIRHLGEAIRLRLDADSSFAALAVAPLQRKGLDLPDSWDTEQTIFPFLLYVTDASGVRRPLRRSETEQVYRSLRDGNGDPASRRFLLGQPVPCGEIDGVAVSALRLCIGTRMLIGTISDAARTISDMHAACDRMVALAQGMAREAPSTVITLDGLA